MNGAELAVLLVVLGVVGLWFGARLFVDAAAAFARRAGLSDLVVGLTVVAIGTGLPEFVVSVDAVLAGSGAVAVGNVVGSNVYNVAVVLGVTAVFGTVSVPRAVLGRDAVALVGSSVLAFAVLRDGRLARPEAAVLLALFVGYLLVLARADDDELHDVPQTGVARPAKTAVELGVGLGLVVASGHVLVDSAVTLARSVGVSEWAIGSTLVAAGTSTPELAVSLTALARGRTGVSVGNVVGSSVFNVLGVLGVAGLIQPLSVGRTALADTLWLVVLTVLTVAVLWTGRRLTRAEGLLLVASEAGRWVVDLIG
ncbi:calcium/sodium antiporter [Halomicrococcus gelatinilyticus]|uniref:calcium/sodium antiporter n=1 Tax=Halomicrococcus gelatinilyticus TaxID=1702103 RepID=UPI002E0FCE07